jgi:pantoate--beta-alanine ligase
MVRDLDVPVEIVGHPTLRDPDGLALSSRNTYLSADERVRALSLSRGLSAAAATFAAGERNAGALVAAARDIIESAVTRLDYLELRDAADLRPVAQIERDAVLAVAAFVGRTRLIDNVVLR